MNKFFIEDLSRKVTGWLSAFDHFVRLDSNNYQLDKYAAYDCLVACGASQKFTVIKKTDSSFSEFREFLAQNRSSWIFGHLSFEAKDIFEIASTILPAHINVPLLSFFVPEIILKIDGDELTIVQTNLAEEIIVNQISRTVIKDVQTQQSGSGVFPFSKQVYLEKVERLLNHIRLGDIYEVNFCQSLHYEDIYLDPYTLYQKLNSTANAPFSTFYKVDDVFLCCASPERFLAKRGKKLICQPIKGTNRRLEDPEDNEQQQHLLRNDPKERSENVMIVDLMRNDLSKIANPGSVKVEELFGVYAFKYVNQMISTIVGEVDSDINFADAMSALFPMGSMTGAPKIRALELTNATESHQRGLFSGSVGYIDPEGDWDFNVVIRSIVYDESAHRASISSGGAITAQANSEAEYNESLLKMESLRGYLD